jgi:hypothetical protein
MNAPALRWASRWPPLAAELVVAKSSSSQGNPLRALVHRLLASPSRLAGLRGLAAPGVLVVAGGELPWVDGAEYFGRDPGAPWLYLPTTRSPSVPAAWLEQRYRRALPDAEWPCVLLPEPFTLVPFARAAPVDAQALRAWADREEAT